MFESGDVTLSYCFLSIKTFLMLFHVIVDFVANTEEDKWSLITLLKKHISFNSLFVSAAVKALINEGDTQRLPNDDATERWLIKDVTQNQYVITK